MNDPNIVFVVSTGRTGSVALARTLQEHCHDVEAVHEPAGSRVLRLAGNAYIAGRIHPTEVRRLLQWTLGRRASRCEAQIYVEVSPHLRSLIDILSETFPRATFVHVVRHPVTYIESYIGHGVFRGVKGGLGHLLPYWLLRPEHLEYSPAKQWHEMGPIEAIAWRWTTLNGLIDRHEEALRDRYHRFRYEDLFYDDDTLSAFARRAGIEPGQLPQTRHAPRANQSSPANTARAGEWPKATADLVESLCGERAARYGYTIPLSHSGGAFA